MTDRLADSLHLHKAWYNHEETPRPLLGINVGFWANERFPRTMKTFPEDRPLNPGDFDDKPYIQDADELHILQQGYGDYPFVAAANTAMCWIEAILGCPVFARYSSSSIWAEQSVKSLEEFEPPDLNNNPWFDKLLEQTEALVKQADGRYQVAPTLMRGPSDLLCAVRGGTNLPLDFYDDPDAVVRAAEAIADVHIAVGKAQLELIPDSDDGYIAGDAALKGWSPNRQIWLQEDAMALMDPPTYSNIFLPIDKRIAASFENCIFHLHGTALWAIDELVEIPDLYAIELNLEDATCDIPGTHEGWHKIQARKPVVVWRKYGADSFDDWLKFVLDEYPKKGLCVQVATAGVEEADVVINAWNREMEERSWV